MATVKWTSSVYGFDFRKFLLSSVEPNIGAYLPSSFNVLDRGPGGYGPAMDTYRGVFTYGSVSSDVSGTVTSITRDENDFISTISGLNLSVKDLDAAAKTTSKTDDMALWARAFAGSDSLTGAKAADRLEGFAGNDMIKGRGGADKLYGGTGADVFIFASVKDSTKTSSGRDTIFDFSSRQRDKIDLKTIDANTKAVGNQAFKFIYSNDFHKKAGELRYEKYGSGVIVSGDVNGDGKADFSIFLKNIMKVSKGDFYL